MDSNKTLKIGLALAAVALLDSPMMAHAADSMSFNGDGKTLGDVPENVTDSLRGVSVLITMVCYLGALVFGVIGAIKWKAYCEQPLLTPIREPVGYWIIAVMLAGFPEFMGDGIIVCFGWDYVEINDLVSEPQRSLPAAE